MGLPIFLLIRFGGECEIRTHGPVTADDFQDRCIKPLYQLPKTWVHLKLGAGHRIRTYVPFLGLITSQVHLTTLPTRLYHLNGETCLAGEVGIEPTTGRLTVACSTAELLTNITMYCSFIKRVIHFPLLMSIILHSGDSFVNDFL